MLSINSFLPSKIEEEEEGREEGERDEEDEGGERK
jgi:hypothetical protein